MAQTIDLMDDGGIPQQPARRDVFSDGTIQYVSPLPPNANDPAAEQRTRLSRKRVVRHELASAPGEVVLIHSMSAGQRADYYGRVSEFLGEEATARDVFPLNAMLVHLTCFTEDGARLIPGEVETADGIKAVQVLFGEFDGEVADELVEVAQEVCALTKGGQPVSTEEDVTVKG